MANIFTDDFNSYNDGNLPTQGGWASYSNGTNFKVQGSVIYEGAKAVYNNTAADSVVTKAGTARADGAQAIYFRSVNRASWYAGRYAQVRISKGSWGSIFALQQFYKDGTWGYWNGSAVATGEGTWNDGEWNSAEIEWRSSDKKARYRINDGTWTDWCLVYGQATYTNFDYIGLNFYNTSGSGGIYFDNIIEAVPAGEGWANIAKVNGLAATNLAKVRGIAVAGIAKRRGIAV